MSNRTKELKGTRTEKNILEAFAGESQARSKYSYYASAARKEGYEQIAAIFLETADQEKAHAKIHLKELNGIGSTTDNLRAAASGELAESTNMYPRMAREARDEGFPEIAAQFEAIGRIEKFHQERYQKLLANMEAGMIFTRNEKMWWKCRNCGYLHEGTTAPDFCWVCKHPKGYFEVVGESL
jgi:rubrerythrin